MRLPTAAERRALLAFAVLLAVALAVRLLAIAATPEFAPIHDPLDYDRHAASIAAGEGYPESTYAPGGGESALRPPLYPYLLAGVYELSGSRWTAGRVFSALLGTLTVGLIALLAHRLWGRRVALVAAAIAAVYPPLVLMSNSLLSESPFLPLMLGALLVALARRERDLRLPALAGVLLGLAVLARPAGVALLPALLAAVWNRPRRARASLAAPAALIAACALVIAPWTVRNGIELDAFVPVSTQDGYLLAGTYNDAARGDRLLPGAYRPVNLVPDLAPLLERRDLEEIELARILREEGTEYVLDHPLYVARVAFWNTLRLFDLSGGHDVSRLVWSDLGIGTRAADAAIYGFWALALVALAGAFTRGARRAPAWLWACPVLLWLSVVVISGTSRYRMPIEPFFVLLAALAVAAAWERRGRVRHRAAPGQPSF